jgi:hypothetical protein
MLPCLLRLLQWMAAVGLDPTLTDGGAVQVSQFHVAGCVKRLSTYKSLVPARGYLTMYVIMRRQEHRLRT